MPKVLRLEWTLPDDAFGEGFDEGGFLTQVKEEVVMRLLKAHRVSQGKAAELLGVDRSVLADLMARYAIPVTDVSPEDMTQECARADALFRGTGA
jgi:predicted HTH domain antitoxin